MTFRDVGFLLIALVTIGSALGVVTFKNIVHSALSLVFTFLGVACIYFHLNANFVGVIQILVYAGAISVLIIFSIMLVMDREPDQTNLPNPSLGSWMMGSYIVAVLTAVLAGTVWFSRFRLTTGPAPHDEVGMLANLMLGRYVVPFEVAAVLLLVAAVGAIILAKGADDQ